MAQCDCAYIAPEVIASGHRCNQCRAAGEAMQHLSQATDLFEYLDSKGWPVFSFMPRLETLRADLALAITGRGPAMKGRK
jgi:hypothetical protein